MSNETTNKAIAAWVADWLPTGEYRQEDGKLQVYLGWADVDGLPAEVRVLLVDEDEFKNWDMVE